MNFKLNGLVDSGVGLTAILYEAGVVMETDGALIGDVMEIDETLIGDVIVTDGAVIGDEIAVPNNKLCMGSMVHILAASK